MRHTFCRKMNLISNQRMLALPTYLGIRCVCGMPSLLETPSSLEGTAGSRRPGSSLSPREKNRPATLGRVGL